MSTLRQAAPRSHIGLRDAVSAEEVYPAAPLAVPQARRLVRSALDGWGLAAMRGDAELVAAELTANAVACGQSAAPAEVLVRVSRTAGYVVIQAGDHSPGGPPAPPRRVAGTAEHGRGLLIACALSARLAWFRDGDWKIVWAALRTPHRDGEPHVSRDRVRRAA
jgi:hypothetical protein